MKCLCVFIWRSQDIPIGFFVEIFYIWNSFTATGDNIRLFANNIDPDETAQWAVSSGFILFDIHSFNFAYKRISKRWFVKIKKQTTNIFWNLARKMRLANLCPKIKVELKEWLWKWALFQKKKNKNKKKNITDRVLSRADFQPSKKVEQI